MSAPTNKRIRAKRQEKRISKFKIAKGSQWAQLKTILAGATGNVWDEIWCENEYTDFIRQQDGIFVNDAFIPLWDITQGIIFLAGGYGSSKTTYAITRLLVKALENNQFKCFYGRQKKTEARELHDNIIREIKRNGWENRFTYSEAPNGTTEIICDNGNLFKMFGCDDVDSLKGIDNPTDILVDEVNQLSFESFGMLFSRLRTPGVELQMMVCFNNCDVYPDHWIRKYIYAEETSEKQSDKVLLDALRKSNIVRHHSIYTDNFFQNPEAYKQTLIVKAGGDEDKIKAYCEGAWGVMLKQQSFYKKFKQDRDVDDFYYNPSYPLLLSFDENVNPYFPATIGQAIGNDYYQIDEITGENPDNTLLYVCEEFIRRYGKEGFNHQAGLEIFGDATSDKEDVKLEKGKNLFTIAMDYLKEFNPVLRVPDSNPNVAMRGTFINLVLHNNYQGLRIHINRKCSKTIDDFMLTQESPDGKSKDKTKVMVNNVRGVQKYGHLTDCFDYVFCEYFRWAYVMFQNGAISAPPTGGIRDVHNTIAQVEKPEPEEEDEVLIINYKRSSRNGFD